MNSIVGPIFNEKVIESGICGSVDSTQVHCSPWKSQQIRALKKKRKKREEKAKNENTDAQTLKPNGYKITKSNTVALKSQNLKGVLYFTRKHKSCVFPF